MTSFNASLGLFKGFSPTAHPLSKGGSFDPFPPGDSRGFFHFAPLTEPSYYVVDSGNLGIASRAILDYLAGYFFGSGANDFQAYPIVAQDHSFVPEHMRRVWVSYVGSYNHGEGAAEEETSSDTIEQSEQQQTAEKEFLFVNHKDFPESVVMTLDAFNECVERSPCLNRNNSSYEPFLRFLYELMVLIPELDCHFSITAPLPLKYLTRLEILKQKIRDFCQTETFLQSCELNPETHQPQLNFFYVFNSFAYVYCKYFEDRKLADVPPFLDQGVFVLYALAQVLLEDRADNQPLRLNRNDHLHVANCIRRCFRYPRQNSEDKNKINLLTAFLSLEAAFLIKYKDSTEAFKTDYEMIAQALYCAILNSKILDQPDTYLNLLNSVLVRIGAPTLKYIPIDVFKRALMYLALNSQTKEFKELFDHVVATFPVSDTWFTLDYLFHSAGISHCLEIVEYLLNALQKLKGEDPEVRAKYLFISLNGALKKRHQKDFKVYEDLLARKEAAYFTPVQLGSLLNTAVGFVDVKFIEFFMNHFIIRSKGIPFEDFQYIFNHALPSSEQNRLAIERALWMYRPTEHQDPQRFSHLKYSLIDFALEQQNLDDLKMILHDYGEGAIALNADLFNRLLYKAPIYAQDEKGIEIFDFLLDVINKAGAQITNQTIYDILNHICCHRDLQWLEKILDWQQALPARVNVNQLAALIQRSAEVGKVDFIKKLITFANSTGQVIPQRDLDEALCGAAKFGEFGAAKELVQYASTTQLSLRVVDPRMKSGIRKACFQEIRRRYPASLSVAALASIGVGFLGIYYQMFRGEEERELY